MKKLVFILALLVGFHAKAQDSEFFNRIDSVVQLVDSTALTGTLDTLKGGLLNEGGTTSDIFILRHDRQVQKISVINKPKNYTQKIIFHKGNPVFVVFSQSNGDKWTYYLAGEKAYSKDGKNINKGSSSYVFSLINSYLNIFKDQIGK